MCCVCPVCSVGTVCVSTRCALCVPCTCTEGSERLLLWSRAPEEPWVYAVLSPPGGLAWGPGRLEKGPWRQNPSFWCAVVAQPCRRKWGTLLELPPPMGFEPSHGRSFCFFARGSLCPRQAPAWSHFPEEPPSSRRHREAGASCFLPLGPPRRAARPWGDSEGDSVERGHPRGCVPRAK